MYISPYIFLIYSLHTPYIYSLYRSEGFTLTGYDIPGCVEDGAWMLWENSSVAAVAVVVVAHPDLGREMRDERREKRDERRETRDERRETRDERREKREERRYI